MAMLFSIARTVTTAIYDGFDSHNELNNQNSHKGHNNHNGLDSHNGYNDLDNPNGYNGYSVFCSGTSWERWSGPKDSFPCP